MIRLNNTSYKKPELVAPAGDIEKLKTAIEYGADAVYVGGEGFNLRLGATNLTPEEIKEITSNSPIQTEVFVHGAMCMSYSGRCLLSSFMSNRHANLGDCSHSCRC